jgi:membrane fusion protein (multidrug efflux system)
MNRIITVIFAISSCTLAGIVNAHPHNKGNGTVPVQVMQIKDTSKQQSIAAVGTIIAPEMADISASVDGHITKILFNNGETVQKQDVLIKLDSATEKANLAKATAKAQSSKLQYERNNELIAQHMISDQDLDSSKAQYLQDQADVNTAQAALDKRSIKAPFAGTVGETKVSVGDYITAGQPLVNIVGQEALRVDYSIPENMLGEIKIGDKVLLHAEIDPQQKITAQLSFIAPSVNPDTHTINCQATITTANTENLRAGMFVNVKQLINSKQNLLMIPEDTIVSANGQTVVYKIKNGSALAVPVKTGIHQKGMVQILNGLQPGDSIISSGQGQVSDGQKIKIVNNPNME